jgi:hypothetical protein
MNSALTPAHMESHCALAQCAPDKKKPTWNKTGELNDFFIRTQFTENI